MLKPGIGTIQPLSVDGKVTAMDALKGNAEWSFSDWGDSAIGVMRAAVWPRVEKRPPLLSVVAGPAWFQSGKSNKRSGGITSQTLHPAEPARQRIGVGDAPRVALGPIEAYVHLHSEAPEVARFWGALGETLARAGWTFTGPTQHAGHNQARGVILEVGGVLHRGDMALSAARALADLLDERGYSCTVIRRAAQMAPHSMYLRVGRID